ncbi:5'-nucleotidase [Branchiostoma belcheri]|nr:5'-nucleotidase [Branchiostoma belcheri]
MARPLFGAFAFVLCGSFLSESAQSFNLTILHTNDVHARVEELNAFGGRCRPGRPCYGGFARLGAKVAEVRGRDDNVLFLDAGDQFQGTLWYYFFKSPVVAQLMNKVTYDAMSTVEFEEYIMVSEVQEPWLSTLKKEEKDSFQDESAVLKTACHEVAVKQPGSGRSDVQAFQTERPHLSLANPEL